MKIKPVIYYIQNYQRKWKEHVNIINTGRIPKQILCYGARGWRSGRDGRKIWDCNRSSDL